MTEWFEYSAEWGYWINPDTFRTPRIKKSIRVGAVFFLKNSETLDDGRQIIVTTYGVVRSERTDEMGKREVSKVLAKQMLDFMRDRKMYPPNTSLKKTYANGNVDLRFAPSEYDVFSIRLTPGLVQGNVDDFLDDLASFKEEETSEGVPWKVEPAKSSRSKCRTCGNTISKGELRLGEPDLYDGHITHRWHHLSCNSQVLRGLDYESLDGFSELTDSQRSQLDNYKDR